MNSDATDSDATAGPWAYWGKARPVEDGADCHLLPFHSLDVAAVGLQYLQRCPALRQWFARQLGTADEDAVCEWLCFWLALHDLGKFSLTFQAQRADLVTRLQGNAPPPPSSAPVRHDSLGMAIWCEVIAPHAEEQAWFGADVEVDMLDLLTHWAAAVTGHHGQPPLVQVSALTHHFRACDMRAAVSFAQAARELFLTPRAAAIPRAFAIEHFEHRSKELSWWVAGLAVLADWIGSNAHIFQYKAEPAATLGAYWPQACARAQRALDASGVLPVARQTPQTLQQFFPHIQQASPLQTWAANVTLADTPQIFLLEDVTGAGKTEAAVMLAHRLMAHGVADGFFIGLPTMATANAMYERIAKVYGLLFADHASLVLAHGRKYLVEGFASSVIAPGADEADVQQQADETATRRCTQWLADHNKRALLAPAGVGTVDQVLLGALQSKHQSLRLLGLVRKVLVIDEVHACDPYMQKTLEVLLQFHARAGGSAILLSATLTRRMKQALLGAFAQGLQHARPRTASSAYPLATSWHGAIDGPAVETPLATRPAVRRSVDVRYLSDEGEVVRGIVAALAAGRCVAWIRNTVGDALAAHAELTRHVPPDSVTLFHARFALGDRLDIEEAVLHQFGPASEPGHRRGRLLIATQVAEQSLDVDFDLVVTDLAPIDRLIQRAGRLHRHVRDAQGLRSTDPGASDGRGTPCLWVLGPAWTDEPTERWLRQSAPRSAKVYPHHGQMWRTAAALRHGTLTMPDDARALIEDVFADDDDLPEGLQRSASQAEGQAYSDAGMAVMNSVKLAGGYQRTGTDWLADTVAPSRLGEETAEVLLGRWEGLVLLPWRQHDNPAHAWAYSTVRVPKRLISEAAPEPDPQRQAALQATRDGLPGGGKWVVLLGLCLSDGGYRAAATGAGRSGPARAAVWSYSPSTGLVKKLVPDGGPPDTNAPQQ